MGHKLLKPYTNEQKAEFIHASECNNPFEDETAFYMLYDYETVQGGEIIDISDTEDYKVKVAELERQRIQALFMTKQDLIRALATLQNKTAGEVYQFVKTILATDIEAQAAWETCNDLYRNNPLVEQFLTNAVGLTDEQIDILFDTVDKAKSQTESEAE